MSELDKYFLSNLKDVSPLLNGRSVIEGYLRSVGLQFGDLREMISKDRLYLDACGASAGRSIISEDNRMNLYLLIKYFLPRIPAGDIIEFGAYKGGNSIFMAYLARELGLESTVYSLDTFSGMPETDLTIDVHKKGDFDDVDYDELENHCHRTLQLTNLKLIRGLFSDTAEKVVAESGDFSLVHIDCDIRSAVEESYESVKQHMVNGGYIVFDDALFSSCLGATEVVENTLIRRDNLNSEQIFPHFVFRSLN